MTLLKYTEAEGWDVRYTKTVVEVVPVVVDGEEGWGFGVVRVSSIGIGDVGEEGVAGDGEVSKQVEDDRVDVLDCEVAGEGVSMVLSARDVLDHHGLLKVCEIMRPAGLAAGEVFLCEEVLEGVVVSEEREGLASLEVVAEGMEGIDDSKEFQLMNGVVAFCRGEFTGFKADGVAIL